MATFKVFSLNVRGVADEVKRKAIFQKHRKNADLLILVETHSSVETEKIWENEWGGKAIFCHGTTSSRGTAIFTSKEHYQNIHNIYTGEDGRTIIIDYHRNDQKVSIAAIYAPNQDSPRFFEDLAVRLRGRHENKIIIGDYNLVLDVDHDRLNTYHNNNKAKEQVEDMADEFCLKDLWRIRNQDKREYSWFKTGNLNKASRIDLALISAGLDQRVELIMYLSSIKTDHRGLYMVLDMDGFERGTGYWKFNSSLLLNPTFLEYMNSELQKSSRLTEHKNPKERWEIIKSRIKKAASKFTREQSREENLVISALTKKVNEYEASLPLTEESDKLWQETKADLEEKLLEKTKGSIFRSKVRWYEQGEKNTKYFFSLEKCKYNAKTCYKLVDDLNQEVTDPQKNSRKTKRILPGPL